jgi:hypothetical protein
MTNAHSTPEEDHSLSRAFVDVLVNKDYSDMSIRSELGARGVEWIIIPSIFLLAWFVASGFANTGSPGAAVFVVAVILLGLLYAVNTAHASTHRNRIEWRLAAVKKRAAVSRLPADLFTNYRVKAMFAAIGCELTFNPFAPYCLPPESPHDLGEWLAKPITSKVAQKAWEHEWFIGDQFGMLCLLVCPVCINSLPVKLFDRPDKTINCPNQSCGTSLTAADVVVVPRRVGDP